MGTPGTEVFYRFMPAGFLTTPCSVISLWYPKSTMVEVIFTKEICKYFKSGID